MKNCSRYYVHTARARALRRGQTLVEYVMILAFISIVAILVLQGLGFKVTEAYAKINSQLDVANPAPPSIPSEPRVVDEA